MIKRGKVGDEIETNLLSNLNEKVRERLVKSEKVLP